MGKHSRNFIPRTPGHTQAPLNLRYRHCSYEPEPMPWLLMGEDFDDITEALEYDPWNDDDDGDDGRHRRPVRV
jgi:hypothetical protein